MEIQETVTVIISADYGLCIQDILSCKRKRAECGDWQRSWVVTGSVTATLRTCLLSTLDVPVTILHLSLKQAANRFDNQNRRAEEEGEEDLEVERGLRKAKRGGIRRTRPWNPLPLQGSSKRWTTGSMNVRMKNCVLSPAAGRRTQLFHLIFTEPGVHLSGHLCSSIFNPQVPLSIHTSMWFSVTTTNLPPHKR